MTVIGIEGDQLNCVWTDLNGHIGSERFPVAAVEREYALSAVSADQFRTLRSLCGFAGIEWRDDYPEKTPGKKANP
jgi:hypothetical protein